MAAEAPADPAKKYLDLKKSKNRATKTLADRYDDLMGVQEWVDIKGEHKTKAKYVAHDPELKWVKLSVTTGSGDKQVVKESTIQLSMLNKASQAKVVQIDKLRKKLDELAAEEKTDAAGAPEMAREGEYGRGERGERAGRAATTDGESRASVTETASSSDAQVDPTQWATSYDAFRANFKFESNESGAKVLGWGQLHDLKAASEAASTKPNRPARDAEAAPAPNPAEALARVGEVHWEGPLVRATKAKSAGGDNEVEFRLAALPRPMKLRFLLDPQESFDDWSKLTSSEEVRFVGRFESVRPRVMVLRVRLADPTAPAEIPTVPTDDRR